MRDNYNLIVHGSKVVLVPYRESYVARYHKWMLDPYVLEMTGSEPLSLEEEYEMQKTWKEDKDKCTFIVLNGYEKENHANHMIGDVNLFMNPYETECKAAEIDIMIAEESHRRNGYGREAVQLMMWYGKNHLQIEKFIAKIKKGNDASMRMFESLGYTLVQYVEVFEEYEYAYTLYENEENTMAVDRHVIDFVQITPYDEDTPTQ